MDDWQWWLILAVLVGALLALMLARVPIAIAMLTVDLVALLVLFGPTLGMNRFGTGAYSSIKSFIYSPIPFFVLLGELIFHSGVVTRAIGVLDRALHRVPVRLGFLATAAGALLGLLSGSTIASTAVLGSSLFPEMIERGYDRRLAAGSILASGGLAMIIPPSALAVLWGATAGVSIGQLLIAGILPGIVMAIGYSVVIFVWGRYLGGAPREPVMEPAAALAPATPVAAAVTVPQAGPGVVTGEVPPASAMAIGGSDGPPASFLRDVAPLGLIILAVLGSIFGGVATASEAAALGAFAAAVVVAGQRALTLQVLRRAFSGTINVTGMILLLIVGATMLTQVLTYTGATRGFIDFVVGLPVGPLGTLFLMMSIVAIMGMFMNASSIMLVTLPLFMPIVAHFEWNGVWFGIIMLIVLQIGMTSPPFGFGLFVMRGLAPDDMKLTDIYMSSLPFIASDILVVFLLVVFPSIVLALPALMG